MEESGMLGRGVSECGKGQRIIEMARVRKDCVENKLMHGCGAIVWYQHECDDLEIWQNGMGQWLWDVGNELIRGKTGWSTFEERERQKQW